MSIDEQDLLDIKRTLVGHVQFSVDGLYTHRLRRQLAEAKVRDGLDMMAESLLSAQRDGLITFHERRWKTAFELPEIITGDKTGIPGSSPERAPEPTVPVLRAIPAQVLSGNTVVKTSSLPAYDPSDTSQVWEVFNTLAAHYIECLRLGAASRASHYADKHKSQFHILRLNARWWPDDAGARSIRISRDDLGADFLKGLSKRTRDPILIGYPLSVSYIASEDIYIVTPMAILQCDISIDEGAVTVTPQTTTPILNPDWVKKRFDRREFRTALRKLADITENDSDEISLAGREGWVDLQQMTQMTSSFLGHQCADRLAPANTMGGLHLRTLDKLQNCVGLFLIAENNYTKGSQADIRSLINNQDIDIRDTALAGFFAGASENVEALPVSAPFDLSEDQFLAARDALSAKVTVISGPPGTGKSQVVASILISAAMNGKTALFSSHTHKAIDAVQQRVDALTPDRIFLMRAGGDESRDIDFKSAINALIANLRESEDKYAHRAAMNRIQEINDEIGAIVALSDEVSSLTLAMGRCWEEKTSRGGISKKVSDGVEVANELPKKASLWARVYRFISSLFLKRSPSIDDLIIELDTSPLSSVDDASLDAELEKLEKVHQHAVAALKVNSDPEQLAKHFAELKVIAERGLKDFLGTLELTSPSHRQRLTELQGAIGLATSRADQLLVWQQYADVIVDHFPIWAGTALSIPSRIPLVPALFDYVIIDEATTCNIAQALPLLARARQVIIVGDKMQTGMVSDLNPGREREMLNDVGLGAVEFAKYSFSQVSLFDLANSLPCAKRHILRDHFRCAPEIAEYISSTFYGSRLMVRTNESALKPPKGTQSGMHWTNIVGPIESAGKGCRSESEALAIAEHITSLVRDQNYGGSIGVVTPFQRQAQLIAIEIERRITFEERERVSLVVGTAHKFQGDDRDLVLLSLCYGPGMPRGSDWFLRNNTDWLNVAVSRARAVCHIFGNREACEQSSIRHIVRLANSLRKTETGTRNSEPVFESPWERALYEALEKAGIAAITQYPLAGRRLDLAVFSGNIKLDVEVDGDTYHRDRDGFRKVSDYWRDHTIKSVGWKVRRFWVYELKKDIGACVERVKQDIADR